MADETHGALRFGKWTQYPDEVTRWAIEQFDAEDAVWFQPVWFADDDIQPLIAAITAALGDDVMCVSRERLREALANAWGCTNGTCLTCATEAEHILAALTAAQEPTP